MILDFKKGHFTRTGGWFDFPHLCPGFACAIMMWIHRHDD